MSEKLSGGRFDLHIQIKSIKDDNFFVVILNWSERVPVEEERREENQWGKSIGVEDESVIGHSGGHGLFAYYH